MSVPNIVENQAFLFEIYEPCSSVQVCVVSKRFLRLHMSHGTGADLDCVMCETRPASTAARCSRTCVIVMETCPGSA